MGSVNLIKLIYIRGFWVHEPIDSNLMITIEPITREIWGAGQLSKCPCCLVSTSTSA